jgi:hypothetical protein
MAIDFNTRVRASLNLLNIVSIRSTSRTRDRCHCLFIIFIVIRPKKCILHSADYLIGEPSTFLILPISDDVE